MAMEASSWPEIELNGDSDEDADLLDCMLQEIQRIQKERPTVAKKMNLTVKGRRQNDQARVERLLQYNGPDSDTISLLEEMADAWFQNPESFWQYGGILDPQSRMLKRCSCILLVEFREEEKKNLPSIEETARRICSYGGEVGNFEEIRHTVNRMIASGHRYKYLETIHGMGLALVLGKGLPETSWTKVLPKSGEAFDTVMARIKTTQIPQMIEKYFQLRERLINYQLGTLSMREVELDALRAHNAQSGAGFCL